MDIFFIFFPHPMFFSNKIPQNTIDDTLWIVFGVSRYFSTWLKSIESSHFDSTWVEVRLEIDLTKNGRIKYINFRQIIYYVCTNLVLWKVLCNQSCLLVNDFTKYVSTEINEHFIFSFWDWEVTMWKFWKSTLTHTLSLAKISWK